MFKRPKRKIKRANIQQRFLYNDCFLLVRNNNVYNDAQKTNDTLVIYLMHQDIQETHCKQGDQGEKHPCRRPELAFD